MIKDSVYLGIDSSNYTSSIALVDFNGSVIFSEKKLLAITQGERGLRQSDAVFAHVKNYPELFHNVYNVLSEQNYTDRISAIGYSAYPRDVNESYMPCFLVGKLIAECLGCFLHIPTIPFSHQAGHVEAALYSSMISDNVHDFIAFHVSGGTTELLLCHREFGEIKIECIGGSLDLHAGQLIDRIGVLLGCSFPAGVSMEKMALSYTGKIGKPKVSVKDFQCNLSGAENLAVQLLNKGASANEVAAFVFSFLSSSLITLTSNLRQRYDLPIVYAGGVMSNSIIKQSLKDNFTNIYFAEPRFSSDNAAGIARLTYRKYNLK